MNTQEKNTGDLKAAKKHEPGCLAAEGQYNCTCSAAQGEGHAAPRDDSVFDPGYWPTRWSDPTYLGDGPWGA